MSPPLRYAVCDGVVHRRVDDETILLDPRSSQYFSINGTGTRLWEAVLAGADRTGLEEVLVEAYGLRADEAHADVEAFLGALVGHGLIEGSSALP